jgi:hypothetical protein
VGLKAPHTRVHVWYECADGCKHQESCSCGTVAVWQELCFQLLVSVQHQTSLSNLHANGGMQVSAESCLLLMIFEFHCFMLNSTQLTVSLESLNSKRKFGMAKRARSTALKFGMFLAIERKTVGALRHLALMFVNPGMSLAGRLFGGTASDLSLCTIPTEQRKRI